MEMYIIEYSSDTEGDTNRVWPVEKEDEMLQWIDDRIRNSYFQIMSIKKVKVIAEYTVGVSLIKK